MMTAILDTLWPLVTQANMMYTFITLAVIVILYTTLARSRL